MNEIKILDVKISNVSYNETIDKIDQFVLSKKPHYVATVNPEIIMTAQKHSQYKKILNDSDLNVADGAGLWWAGKYTGQKLEFRVTGVDLIERLCQLSQEKNYSIFFLGGVDKAGERSVKKLQQKYPRLKIAGIYEGFPNIKDKLSDSEKKNNLDIIKTITDKKPDILLVAYGAPKQEQFIYQYKDHLNVPVMIGVGGSFDFISGKIRRAPRWMQTIHMEWLFRIINQPSRISRIITATIKFPLAVFLNSLKK